MLWRVWLVRRKDQRERSDGVVTELAKPDANDFLRGDCAPQTLIDLA
jgi:hypothetical protein